MASGSHIESHHGVLMNINGHGVFILGEPAIGKSSLALELLYQGHRLIADDIAEFERNGPQVTGHCPTLLSELLHTRELGLISIIEVFGKTAWRPDTKLNYVVMLHQDASPKAAQGLSPTLDEYTICQQVFPVLRLCTNNPASLPHRIETWLKLQVHRQDAIQRFSQRKDKVMP